MPCTHTQISSFLHKLINWFLALALSPNNLLYVPLPLLSFKFYLLLLKHIAWMSRKLQIFCWYINTANLHHRNWHHNKVWNMPHTNSFQEREKSHTKKHQLEVQKFPPSLVLRNASTHKKFFLFLFLICCGVVAMAA